MRPCSCEFFPPRDAEGAVRLDEAADELMAGVSPAFFSVTFGAGGSTKSGTLETVTRLRARGIMAAPHISGLCSTREEISGLLDAYRKLGVDRLVVLRGDQPKEGAVQGDFPHASDLVAFIRERTGRAFHLEVAAYPEFHPESASPDDDLAHFVAKMRAGADSAMTQYFYNADAYFRFVDAAAARGVTALIVPGIMPITNYKQIARFSDACGAEIPRWIRKRLEGFGDDLESLRAFGLDVVAELCERLLAGGAPGLHYYTLNRAAPSVALHQRLAHGGLGDR